MYSEDSFRHLNLPKHYKKLLANISNNSLAKSTWSSYRTSLNKLDQYAEETGNSIAFPTSKDTVLSFTAWLLSKGVGTSTVNTYLSGLRQAHMTMGMEPPNLHTNLVNQVLQGKQNLENLDRVNKKNPCRLPMTIILMRILRKELKTARLNDMDRGAVWAVATLAFSGGFRPGELLCSKEWSFDPAVNLLKRDIKVKTLVIDGERTEILQIKMKAEKQNKKGGINLIDVYASDGKLCPVKAYQDWDGLNATRRKDGPAFCRSDGAAMTKNFFNAILKRTLNKHIDGVNGFISGHSFRTGMASLLGSLGYHEQDIMKAGRWSSSAYLSYLKLPRTRRMHIAKKIAEATRL